ncbi:MAG TPA: hypothetical protein VMF06_08565 [Candidatus Limnocylindria bacterium]|jgi:hypothetical protein|nr:hypothetical protein [Candidatus Limnocylindria bacterium]
MINTNELIRLGFGLVADFARLVDDRPDWVPRSTNDCDRVVLASNRTPFSVAYLPKHGSHYWVSGGIVEAFDSPWSVQALDDPGLLPKLAGVPTLSSNEVMELANRTIAGLAKVGNPILGVVPIVKGPTTLPGGQIIPYYSIEWPVSRGIQYGRIAEIEIDAARRRISHVFLFDEGFKDRAFLEIISNRVYTPDPPPPPAPVVKINRSTNPLPDAGVVRQLLDELPIFGSRVGIGIDTALTENSIDWDRTTTLRVADRSGVQMLAFVGFKNGGGAFCLEGHPLSYLRGDAQYNTARQSSLAIGRSIVDKVRPKTWEECAKALEQRLCREYGISMSRFEIYRARIVADDPESARCLVEWHSDAEIAAQQDVSPRPMVAAEFDRKDGSLKLISFRDRALINGGRR